MDGGVGCILLGNGDGTFRALSPAQSGLLAAVDAKSLVVTDLDGQAGPDLVIGVNDGEPLAFVHRDDKKQFVRIRLIGPVGNRQAIGTKLVATTRDQKKRSRTIHGGGSYLSHSTCEIFFGYDHADPILEVTIVWQCGLRQVVNLDESQQELLVLHPSRKRRNKELAKFKIAASQSNELQLFLAAEKYASQRVNSGRRLLANGNKPAALLEFRQAFQADW